MSPISTCLWFDGQAEQAAKFYVSLIPGSRIDNIARFPIDTPGGGAGGVMVVAFTLAGQSWMALNGGPHFHFTPAISIVMRCRDQAEIDRLWAALGDGGVTMPCGWLTDRYGVTWQIVPEELAAMIGDGGSDRARRVMQELLTMTRIDIDRLRAAHQG